MLSCARFDNKPGMTTQVLRRLKRLLGLNMVRALVLEGRAGTDWKQGDT